MQETTELLVEIGRVCYVSHGPCKRLPCVIIDIVDINRCYVDGGNSGVPRMILSYNDITLLPYVIEIPKSVSNQDLIEVLEKTEVYDKYNQTEVGKDRLKEIKSKKMNDFERFKLNHLKRLKAQIVKDALRKYMQEDYNNRKGDYVEAKAIKKGQKTEKLSSFKKKQRRYHHARRQYLLRFRPLMRGLY